MNLLGKKFWSGTGATLLLTTAIVLMYSSCGDDEVNVFQPVAEPFALKNDQDAKLEQVMVLLDKKKYSEALEIIEPMIDDTNEDSNKARILFASAKLGQAQLDIWSVIKNIINTDTASGGGSGEGIDNIFDSFSESVLGTDDLRQAKVDALAESLSTLLSAPAPEERKLQNTACLFAGLLAVPTIADATDALNDLQSALGQIRDAAGSGGTVCPNISILDTAANEVVSATSNFNLVLQAAQTCPFLDLDEAKNLMNTVEQSMSNLRTAADKGCDTLPSCPAGLPDCSALFPPCVQEALTVGTSSAVAGDRQIATCELALHCINPASCFQ
jgi:hypothetical protein